MESNTCFSSQQALCRDVEQGKKEDKARYRSYQCAAIILSAVLLIMALGILSLRFVWRPGPWKVYDHHYTALLDGKETQSMMEIDPVKRLEMFQIGNGTDEVIEVHDFKNGIMGIRFAKHQRCYIRAQTKKLPVPTEVHPKDDAIEVNEQSDMDMQMEPQIWIPAEEPITNNTFLLNSKIWEICQKLPIHWIHPSPLKEFSDIEDVDQIPEMEAGGARRARDVMDQLPVNDYRDVGLELDNRLDEQGYCCQYCRRGYRYCRRYYEPLGGYSPYPYFYQGGRVICQIVMPCDWWIARMLGRI